MLPSNQEREWCHCTAGYVVIFFLKIKKSDALVSVQNVLLLSHVICLSLTELRKQTILSCRSIKTWGVVDRFYIARALFSALEQTHCALFAYDSKWVIVAFYSALWIYPPKWSSCSAVWFLHGWCHSKLLPSRRVLCTPSSYASYHVTSSVCVHHPAMLHITLLRPSVYTIQLCFISRHFVRLCTPSNYASYHVTSSVCVHHPTMLHITLLRPSVYTIQLCFISRHFVRLCTPSNYASYHVTSSVCVHHPTMLHITSLRPSVYTIQLCFISRHFVRLCTPSNYASYHVTSSVCVHVNNLYTYVYDTTQFRGRCQLIINAPAWINVLTVQIVVGLLGSNGRKIATFSRNVCFNPLHALQVLQAITSQRTETSPPLVWTHYRLTHYICCRCE